MYPILIGLPTYLYFAEFPHFSTTMAKKHTKPSKAANLKAGKALTHIRAASRHSKKPSSKSVKTQLFLKSLIYSYHQDSTFLLSILYTASTLH